MNPLYKSSLFRTIFSYVFYLPLIIIIWCIFFYGLILSGFSIIAIIYYLPILLLLTTSQIFSTIKLRYIKVNKDGILIKTLNGDKLLEYKDIEWINQPLFSPISYWGHILIKYKNKENDKNKIIIIFPEFINFFAVAYTKFSIWEFDMTKYIREQVIKSNPTYSIENEPSRWYLFKLFFFSFIIILLLLIFITFIIKIL